MGSKPYHQRIVSKLRILAEWNDLEDGQSISEWRDQEVGEFFRWVAEGVQEEMGKRSPKGSVARAFATAKLQPDVPMNWLYLLGAFTDVHFQRVVTKRKYDKQFKATLWKRMKKIIDSQKRRSLAAACAILVREYPHDYGEKGEGSKKKSAHRRDQELTAHAHRLRNAVSDFGWSPADFDHKSPPRFGRK